MHLLCAQTKSHAQDPEGGNPEGGDPEGEDPEGGDPEGGNPEFTGINGFSPEAPGSVVEGDGMGKERLGDQKVGCSAHWGGTHQLCSSSAGSEGDGLGSTADPPTVPTLGWAS